MRKWINAACRLTEATNYAPTLTAYEVLQLMETIHHSPEDFDTGDINHRVWKFTRYVFQQLPVADLHSPWNLDDQRVADYATRMRQGETPPPIIYDADADVMIDGGHRLAAAQLAGLHSLPAYVGLPENIDPDWDEESDADEDE